MAIKPPDSDNAKAPNADAPNAGATDTKQAPADAAPAPDTPADPAAPAKKRSPIPIILAAIVLIGGVAFAISHYLWAQGHVSDDDAQIQADLVLIAPQVSGTVTKVYVTDNQIVKAGDLLVQLDPATYQTAVDSAKADLDASVAVARGARATVGLTDATGDAQIQQGQAGLQAASTGIASSAADVSRYSALIGNNLALVKSAQATATAARDNYHALQAAITRATEGLRASQSQAATAQAAVRVALAQVTADTATAQRAERDATRYQTLFNQGAVSASTADSATAASQVAQAQLQAAQATVAQARSNLQTQISNVASARSQVDSARAAAAQALAQISAADGQVQAAKFAVSQAEAQKSAAQVAIENARAKVLQAQAELTQAKTAPRQVKVSRQSADQAVARSETAQAALENAKINLERTRLRAPVDGKISRKSVTIGDLVAPGTSLMSIVPSTPPWVIANFKETELTNVRVGQVAEVEVDAFPGETFHGHVDSISGGTGATFSLLPPDNATGNFTKVVQRVPVKIVFDANQPALSKLTVGMSVTATINTK